jgi:hypothetical protein
MGERRGDVMTAFKTAMNNYQNFLHTNTKTGNFLRTSFSRINFDILSMFYAQYDNIGSMYKLAVKVIDDTLNLFLFCNREYFGL